MSTTTLPIGRVSTPRFALYLLVGLFAWNYFSGAVSAAADAIAGNGAMLKSVAFPRVVLPLSVVLFHLVQYVLALVVLQPVLMFAYDVPLGWQFLALPPFLEKRRAEIERGLKPLVG